MEHYWNTRAYFTISNGLLSEPWRKWRYVTTTNSTSADKIASHTTPLVFIDE